MCTLIVSEYKAGSGFDCLQSWYNVLVADLLA